MVNLVPHFLSILEQKRQTFPSNMVVEDDMFLADDDLRCIGPVEDDN